MIRDIFYYGKKPNIHPREKQAHSLEDARQQCTTEHFWIINEYCDYSNFDWDFDFDFLPDEDVWAHEHNNVWPSQWQKDSGTWLCPKENSDITVYRADVTPVNRKNEITSEWTVKHKIDTSSFDFSWHPDPTDPAYNYVFGNQHYSSYAMPTVEYHVEGATTNKYMTDIICSLAPRPELFEVLEEVVDFDYTWTPDPFSPPYIYVWGGEQYSATVYPIVKYHQEGATEHKFIDDLKVKIADNPKLFETLLPVKDFDYSWRPDPFSPPYIYVWGNQWYPGSVMPTVRFVVPGATDTKYIEDVVATLAPQPNKFKLLEKIDDFDFSWVPDPYSPPFIYVFGNQWHDSATMPTVEYHCAGATDRKYVTEIIAKTASLPKLFEILHPIESFDYSWRPNPSEPPFIYVFGNTQHPGTVMPTVKYITHGATEVKYVNDVVAKLAPQPNKFQTLDNVEDFDYSWVPDPTSPPYNYVWGNQWHGPEKKTSVEYIMPGATEYKYMTERAKRKADMSKWHIPILIDSEKFDFSWEPDPTSPPYIYEFGTQHQKTGGPVYAVPGALEIKYEDSMKSHIRQGNFQHWELTRSIDLKSFDFSWHPDSTDDPFIYQFGTQWQKTGGPRYITPGATEIKYVDGIKANNLFDKTNWKELIPIKSFDYSWHPDDSEEPFIYVFGNKWNDAATEASVEYHVSGATKRKYVDTLVAIPTAQMGYWKVNSQHDADTFDFSWRPNPHSPAQIYQWADNGPRYSIPGAKEVVLMERTKDISNQFASRYTIETTLDDLVNKHPDEVFWAINPDLNYDKFDFEWKPNEENFKHINTFGNEYSKDTHTYYVNGPTYMMGHREFNYVEEQQVTIDTNLSMFYVDRGNSESQQRYDILKIRYPKIQKTRYLNSWIDTIKRCINKSDTNLFWILNSELNYNSFEFDFYPSPWQMKMVHVFGTQWSHWGNTYLINKESFVEDTKHIKVIEHLKMINFVKDKRTNATNCLYDVYLIDHGNEYADTINMPVTTITFENSYLETFKKMLETLPIKNEHYVWVCSSICDYTNFDFSYISDPYAKDQLHVFPSDSQKFGDTFLIDVNKLRRLIVDMKLLEDYEKVNYNSHQKVKRLPAPHIVVEADTHCEIHKHDFTFPYCEFVTRENQFLSSNQNDIPMSLWSLEHRNIIIKSTGGSKISAPKDIKNYVNKELYDYPYIIENEKVITSQPLDIVFLSNGELCADEHYHHLLEVTKDLPNRVVRVDNVNGRVAAYHAAAEASFSPWFFAVFAKLKVNSKFDFSWQPDRLQVPKHYIFYASNPVNGLVYGHQAMIAYNKELTLGNSGKGLDFTLDNDHEVVELNSGVARYNTDEFTTWRTSFRECIKLKLDNSPISKDRLKTWSTVGEGPFAQYSINGALDSVEYFNSVDGDITKLRLSYDWPWLQEYFSNKYN